VGRIAGRIAVAGGGDWGTDTIEILDQNRRWETNLKRQYQQICVYVV
jgi:hypothetical protein